MKYPHLGVVVEILGEILDARAEGDPAQEASLLPEGATARVHVLGEILEIIVVVQLIIRTAKEQEEVFIARQVFNRGKLQFQDAKVTPVEIDGLNMFRLMDQIVEDVAAAGGDRQHPAFRRQGQGLEIDAGVFPNLVVNETIEPEGEESLGHSLPAQRMIVVNGTFEIFGSGRVHGFRGKSGLGSEKTTLG